MKRLKEIFKSIFKLRNFAFVFGISILTYMIYKIGIENIFDNVKQIGWWFFAIISTWGVGYLVNALAWYMIINDDIERRVKYSEVLRLTISGYALNYITPFGLAGGEPYRILELKKHISTEKATSSVILYAMMHVCSHFFFWLATIILIAWFVELSLGVSIAMSIIVLMCLILIFLFFRGYKKGLVMTLTRFFGKVPFLRKRIKKLKPSTIERLNIIDTQIKGLKGKRQKTFYFALSLEFLARLVNAVEILLIIYAMGYYANYVDALIIVGLSSLFANILFFSPMQLGTREGGLMLAFKTIGLAPGLIISVSMIKRIRELFWIGIGLLLMKFCFQKNPVIPLDIETKKDE